MDKEIGQKIESILENCVKRALLRVKKGKTSRPFHEALLTKELVYASSFERSFSTSFGQGPIEEISQLVATGAGYETKRQKHTLVNVFKGASDEIERICSDLRSGDKRPNWRSELEKVLAHQKGVTEVRKVISDLWLRKENKEIFISIKTVKPNLDQVEKVKKEMLLLASHDHNYDTYLGLYYNPGGNTRQDYNWSVPSKIFDMHNDQVVLIGKDYWDFLGGSGTYDSLLSIFEKVGKETRKSIANI